jgi:hypothetical protein
MSKRIATICALIGVAALLAAPAYAEVQNIKISGDITAMGVFHDNFDLEDARLDFAEINSAWGLGTSNLPAEYPSDDEDMFFMSAVRLRVDADLTDNVSAAVQVANLREWDVDRNIDIGAATGPDSIMNAGAIANTAQQEDNASIILDLAYITLKEMLYSPLTLVIGRQNLSYGRELIIGNGAYWDPNNSIAHPELSPLHGRDSIRAILDYDPWTMDIVMIKLFEADDTQNNAFIPVTQGADRDSDTEIYGANLGYEFQGETPGEAEGYVWYMRDEQYAMTVQNNASPNNMIVFDDSETVCAGLRGSWVPMDNFTIGGEVAGQWGEISAQDGPRPDNAAHTRDRQAMLGNAFGEYTFSDIKLTPVVGLEYLYTSGEEIGSDGDYEAWNPMLRGKIMGQIRDYLETMYPTLDAADTDGFTNQHTIKATCGIDLGDFVDGLSLDLAYLHYWFAEDPSVTNQDDDLGDEVNLAVVYDYTEDVQFRVDSAWFMPGDYYDMVHIWRGHQGDVNLGANTIVGPGFTRTFDDMAVRVVGSCKVSF